MFGTNTSLTTGGSRLLTQKGPIPGSSEKGDGFGRALTIGDLHGDNKPSARQPKTGGYIRDPGRLTVIPNA